MKKDLASTIGVVLLAVGLIMSAGVGYLVYETTRPKPTFKVFAANTNLPATTVLDLSSHVEPIEVPDNEKFRPLKAVAFYIDSRLNAEAARAGVDGRPVSCDINAGDLILFQCTKPDAPNASLEQTIDPNMRAISVTVNQETSVAFFVRPGSLVDIIGTVVSTEGEKIVETTGILLQGVKVIAVDDARTEGGYASQRDGAYSTVTLLVTPEQAEELTHLRRRVAGPLTLALRNPGDQERVTSERRGVSLERPGIRWTQP